MGGPQSQPLINLLKLKLSGSDIKQTNKNIKLQQIIIQWGIATQLQCQGAHNSQ